MAPARVRSGARRRTGRAARRRPRDRARTTRTHRHPNGPAAEPRPRSPFGQARIQPPGEDDDLLDGIALECGRGVHVVTRLDPAGFSELGVTRRSRTVPGGSAGPVELQTRAVLGQVQGGAGRLVRHQVQQGAPHGHLMAGTPARGPVQQLLIQQDICAVIGRTWSAPWPTITRSARLLGPDRPAVAGYGLQGPAEGFRTAGRHDPQVELSRGWTRWEYCRP